MNLTLSKTLSSIPFCQLTASEILVQIGNAIEHGQQSILTVLDAAMVINIKSNSASWDAVCASEFIVADGYYVALALRFLGYGFINQITGFQTALDVMQLAKEKSYKIFFLGAEEAVVRNVVSYAEKNYGSIVAGFHNGYFDAEQSEAIVDELNNSGANIVFVGISSPKREMFLHQYRKQLAAPFLMGVGGVFDILGGKTQRAPELLIKCRLEWLYRFLLEPRRMWKRVFYAYPYFVWCVLIERFSIIFNKSDSADRS